MASGSGSGVSVWLFGLAILLDGAPSVRVWKRVSVNQIGTVERRCFEMFMIKQLTLDVFGQLVDETFCFGTAAMRPSLLFTRVFAHLISFLTAYGCTGLSLCAELVVIVSECIVFGVCGVIGFGSDRVRGIWVSFFARRVCIPRQTLLAALQRLCDCGRSMGSPSDCGPAMPRRLVFGVTEIACDTRPSELLP